MYSFLCISMEVFIILVIILLILLVVIYSRIKQNENYWKIRNIPYRNPCFFFGSLYDILCGNRPIGKYLGYLYRKFNTPYFGIFICGKPYLVIKSPTIIKNITIRDFHNFTDRTFACDQYADILAAKSVFLAKNPEWRNLRSKLSGIFTSMKLKNMFPLMLIKGKTMQNYLNNYNETIIDIKEINGKFMTDIMASCFFGINAMSFDKNNKSEFRQNVRKMIKFTNYDYFCLFSYFLLPQLVTIFKLRFVNSNYLRDVFLKELYQRELTGLNRNDFIDLLINIRDHVDEKNDNKFDTTTILSQSIIFFIAGFETTSNLLSFALYELSLRIECQEKLRNEILEFFPNNNTPIIYDRIQQMKYLEMVLFEVLRRYPFSSFLNRKCKSDYVIDETGVKIDKGTAILIPIDGIHMDNKFYDNPDKFEPERFQNGIKHLMSNCVFMPFGLGPRNCIGERFGLLSAKIGLVHFLQKFKVERCNETPVPIELDKKSPFVTPTKSIYLKLIKM